MNLRDIGEFGLIDKIKQVAAKPGQQLVLGIDDDAAAFQTSPETLTLVSTDAFVEGVHFKLDYFSFYQLGWRCLAANISDIAAMGGKPQYALVSIALPESVCVEDVDEFYRGMQALANRHQTFIIGGDTTASPDRLFVNITIIGSVKPDKMARRSGAQIGDTILVTGYPGLAAVGCETLNSGKGQMHYSFACQRHLQPEPRAGEADFLVNNFEIHAMIDISDGIASEIHHICKQSKTGALVEKAAINIHKEIRHFSENVTKPAIDFPLYGGEDFELLFTAPAERTTQIIQSFKNKFNLNCFQIGKVHSADFGIKLLDENGNETNLPASGYEHFSAIE